MAAERHATVALPAAALEVVLGAARRELSRLRGWASQGARHLGDEADELELEPAITVSEDAVARAAGEPVPLPAMTAATLRFYATRELGRLSGMGMLWGEDDPDLDRQADTLRAALAHIPFTLAPVNAVMPPVNAGAAASSGVAVHG